MSDLTSCKRLSTDEILEHMTFYKATVRRSVLTNNLVKLILGCMTD